MIAPSIPLERRITPPVLTSSRPTVVLIADDHEDSRTIGRLMLESAGFCVVEATTGLEAIRVARATAPTIILLDMIMPVLDGFATARRLRADVSTSYAAIIGFTALARASDRERALAAGCDEVLTKPIHPRSLLETLVRYTVYQTRASAAARMPPA